MQIAATVFLAEIIVSRTVSHLFIVLIIENDNFKSFSVNLKSIHATHSIFSVTLFPKLNYCVTLTLLSNRVFRQVNMFNLSKRIEELLNITMSNATTEGIF